MIPPTIVAILTTSPSPSFGFKHDPDLRIPNYLATACAQPALSAEVIIQDCSIILRAISNSEEDFSNVPQVLLFLGAAYVRKGQN